MPCIDTSTRGGMSSFSSVAVVMGNKLAKSNDIHVRGLISGLIRAQI